MDKYWVHINRVQFHPIEIAAEMKTTRHRASCPRCRFKAQAQSPAALDAALTEHARYHDRADIAA